MKRLLSAAICCLICLIAIGKRNNAVMGEAMRSLYSNSATTTVKRVRQTSDECLVTLHVAAPQGDYFSISPRMYLSDEQGNRHPLLRAEGVEIGKKEYITQPSGREFTLTFEALPEGTRYFDLIEGAKETDWRIYGIHDKRDERSFPKVHISKDDPELSQQFFTSAPITIKGRFADYQRRGMPHIVRFNYSSESQDTPNPTAYPFCCMVQADGTFEYRFTHDRPIWAKMAFDQGGHDVGFYVRPGDMLEVTLSNLGQENEHITYHYAAGRATNEGLFKRTIDVPYNKPDKQAQYLTPDIYRQMMDSIIKATDEGISYQAWKWHLSPWEAHLLKTSHRIELLNMYMFFCGTYYDIKNRPYWEKNQPAAFYMSDEDAAYLHKLVDWADPSNAIPQQWYGANNYLFSHTEVEKSRYEYWRSHNTDDGPFLGKPFEAAVKRILPNIAPILMSDVVENEKAKDQSSRTLITIPAQDPVAAALMKRLAQEAGSRYVQVVLLDPRGADYNHNVSGQTHWMADFHDDLYMSLIFVISDSMNDKDKETLAFWFREEKRVLITEEEFIHLQAALRITNPAGTATINKDGNILSFRLDSGREESFRSDVRALKRLEEKAGL